MSHALRSYVRYIGRMVPGAEVCFFNDPPTAEIYTLSLHDALPICGYRSTRVRTRRCRRRPRWRRESADRKSTRLNSSHQIISYAVFCLKKKTKVIVLMEMAGVHKCLIVAVLFVLPNVTSFAVRTRI